MGVTIVVENDVHVRDTVARSAESLAALVEAVARPNVKVNFDTGHAFLGAGLTEEFDGALMTSFCIEGIFSPIDYCSKI